MPMFKPAAGPPACQPARMRAYAYAYGYACAYAYAYANADDRDGPGFLRPGRVNGLWTGINYLWTGVNGLLYFSRTKSSLP